MTRDLERPVRIRTADAMLDGDLCTPQVPVAVVLFAHGSGSSRLSPRNRYVAELLNQRGLATLLMDLLTPAEEQRDALSGELRFDIGFLAERLVAATDWIAAQPDLTELPLGYFGASTGAAAALLAAARRSERVGAVVSRGGRPDLAGDALPDVRASTLLIVGERDPQVLDLNHGALEAMTCQRELLIVPGATHLFEEPGALDEVARLAGDWFLRRLVRAAQPA
jgi:putative phosphoribosyl transferase